VAVPMICATSVMKPGPTRIGRIGGNITLPRTVPVINLAAAIVGALAGLALAVSIGDGGNSTLIALGLGAFAGWMAVTYSPLKNESLAKWIELQIKSQTRARYVNGERVILAVGVAVTDGPSSGRVVVRRSAARVAPGQFDDRGAPVPTVRGRLDPAAMLVDVDPAAGMPERRRERRARPHDPLAGAAVAAQVPTPGLPAARTAAPAGRVRARRQATAAPMDLPDDPLAGPPRRLKD